MPYWAGIGVLGSRTKRPRYTARKTYTDYSSCENLFPMNKCSNNYCLCIYNWATKKIRNGAKPTWSKPAVTGPSADDIRAQASSSHPRTSEKIPAITRAHGWMTSVFKTDSPISNARVVCRALVLTYFRFQSFGYSVSGLYVNWKHTLETWSLGNICIWKKWILETYELDWLKMYDHFEEINIRSIRWKFTKLKTNV